jgi:hypothetical protein
VEERGIYLLPVRLDDTELPGLRPTVGYLDGRRTSPDEVAAAIVQKLGRSPTVQTAAPVASPVRVPKVAPADFNPYAEAEDAANVLKRTLTNRGAKLRDQGLVFHARETNVRFEVRVLRQGTTLYSLDFWVGDEGFGDNALCFNDAGGAGSRRGQTATGRVEWDRERGLTVVRLMNFSMLDKVGGDYLLTPEELADAVWEKLCRQVEQ